MKKLLFIGLPVLGVIFFIFMALMFVACMDIATDFDPQSTDDFKTNPIIETTDAKETSGIKETIAQKNAIESAKSYLSFTSFSKSELIAQLEHEGYSKKDSTYAVEKLNIDFNEQAAEAAKSYLDSMAFSKSGLIEQLEFEGYTKEQAEYGVKEVYK